VFCAGFSCEPPHRFEATAIPDAALPCVAHALRPSFLCQQLESSQASPGLKNSSAPRARNRRSPAMSTASKGPDHSSSVIDVILAVPAIGNGAPLPALVPLPDRRPAVERLLIAMRVIPFPARATRGIRVLCGGSGCFAGDPGALSTASPPEPAFAQSVQRSGTQYNLLNHNDMCVL
jgi:hypothetical protein